MIYENGVKKMEKIVKFVDERANEKNSQGMLNNHFNQIRMQAR